MNYNFRMKMFNSDIQEIVNLKPSTAVGGHALFAIILRKEQFFLT